MPQRWADESARKPLRRNGSITRESATGIPQPWDRPVDWHPLGSTRGDQGVPAHHVADPREARRMVERVDRADRLAYHEAGHALVGWRLGRSLVDVRIRLDERDGSTSYLDTVAGVEDRLACLLAGSLAARWFADCDERSDGGSHDRGVVAALAPIAGETRMIAARDKAESLVRQGESAIRALAGALIRHRRLSGADAVSILAEHWVPDTAPPPLAAVRSGGNPPSNRVTAGRSRADMTDAERRTAFPHLYGAHERDYAWQPTYC